MSSLSAVAWLDPAPRPPWVSLATTSRSSRTTTHLVVPTASLLRVASTAPRITRTMATRYTACSTTPSRVATSAHAKPTCIAWPKSASTSSTRPPPKVSPSPVTTAGCSTTVHSVARRYLARSTPEARPVSSCCSVHTRRSCARSALARSSFTPAPKCSTLSCTTALLVVWSFVT